MSNSGRPLSPHLSIYRWPITMTLSILHRVSGAGLSLGLIALSVWLMSIATGGESYGQLSDFFRSVLGRLMLGGWSLAFFFHVSNGVRHLFWDAGRGFEKRHANASSWFVIVTTIVFTAAFWIAVGR